jgi:hypothetical protein
MEGKMDERFQKSRPWIIFGALGVLFLCLMLCGLVTMAFGVMGSGPVYGTIPQAPGAEGAAPPQVYHGPWTMGGPVGFVAQGVGVLLKLAFLGLLVLLFIGLLRRLFWGPHHCTPGYWGRPPEGQDWKAKAHPGWGAWARHWHGEPPGQRSEPASPNDEPEDPDLAYRGAE